MKTRLYLYQLTTTGNGGLNGRIISVPETDQAEADKKAARVAAMNGCGIIRKGEL
jgi:hypothetical protein